MSDAFNKALQAQISQLPRDRAPSRDLWPGIEMAVLHRKPQQWPRLAIAASLLVCMIGGVVWWHAASVGELQQPVASNPTSANESAYVLQLDRQHRATLVALQGAFKDTPALTTNWQQQLDDMERAAESIKKALQEDPTNVTLLKMLNDVYQKEIDLLRRVHSPVTQYNRMI